MKINSVNTVSLGEVLEYEQPTNYIVDNTNYDDEFEIPVLTAGKSFLLGYTNETHNVFRNVPVIIFDDFTTAFKYVDFPFKVKSSAMKILKANKEIADIRFLYYRMMKTGIDTELHKRYWISKYSKVKIPLPPLDQQKKIAAILDAADAYRQKTKALIEKYDELTQSLFLDMFGDPVTNPKGWEKKGLSKLGNVVTGSTPPSSKEGMFGGNIPFVTPGDLGHDRPVKRTVTREGTENSRVVRKGSLFLCCIGATIGKKGIARTDSSFNQQINAVEWNELINDYWGLYAFTWLKHEVIERAISTTLPIMKKSEFEKVKVPCPPIYLQNQFAERVQLIEAQKAQAQASLVQSEDLFNSLIQRAFKGELV